MTVTQKVILFALLVVGGLCLIVGFTLMHYIGGFLRTVEEEAREQEQADEAARADEETVPAEDETGPDNIS